MFRAIISPIFNSGGTSLPGYRPATSWVLCTTNCNTQSSAPEDGLNYRQKHVELIGIINKPLLLHLVGCLYCLYQWCTVRLTSNLQPISLWVEIQTDFLSNTSPEVFLHTSVQRINLKIKNLFLKGWGYPEKLQTWQAAPDLMQCILVTFNRFILSPFAVGFSLFSTELNKGWCAVLDPLCANFIELILSRLLTRQSVLAQFPAFII